MVLIWTKEVTNDKHRIVGSHHRPELLTESQKEGSIEVDDFQFIEAPIGYSTDYFFNPETGEVYTEFSKLPESDSDKIKRLEEVLADLTELILLGGAN